MENWGGLGQKSSSPESEGSSIADGKAMTGVGREGSGRMSLVEVQLILGVSVAWLALSSSDRTMRARSRISFPSLYF